MARLPLLNPNHPINRGCVFGWDASTPQIELVTGKLGTVTNSTVESGPPDRVLRKFAGGTYGASQVSFGTFAGTANLHQTEGSWLFYVRFATTTNNAICCHTDNNTDRGWMLTNGRVGKALAHISVRSNINRIRTVLNAPTIGWHRVAVTVAADGLAANAHIYIDGAEVAYDTTADGLKDADGTTGVASSESLILAGQRFYTTQSLDGGIGNGRIYNRILSSTELLQWALDPYVGFRETPKLWLFGSETASPTTVAVSAVAGGPTSAAALAVGAPISTAVAATAGGPTSAAVGTSGEPIPDVFTENAMTGTVTGLYFDLPEQPSACIVKDSVTGQWVTLLSDTSQNLALYVSSDGRTFAKTGSTIRTSSWAAIGLAQDASGALHFTHIWGSSWAYGRISLTRSGGVITGGTLVTAFSLPSTPSGGTSVKCRVVTNGSGAARVVFWGTGGNNTGTWFAHVCHSGLTPSSASDCLSLSGTANAWTSLTSHSQSSGNWAPYFFHAELQQIGTSGNLYLFTGPSGRADAGNYAAAIYGHLLVAAGSNWSESTITTVAADSWESMLGASYGAGGIMYQPYTYRESGTSDVLVRVARIAADGTVTSSIADDLNIGTSLTELSTHLTVTTAGSLIVAGCAVDVTGTSYVVVAEHQNGEWSTPTQMGVGGAEDLNLFPSRCGQDPHMLVVGCGTGASSTTLYVGNVAVNVITSAVSAVAGGPTSAASVAVWTPISAAMSAAAGGPTSAAAMATGEPISAVSASTAGGPTSAVAASVGQPISAAMAAVAGGPTSSCAGAVGEPISATVSAVAGGPTSAAAGLVGVPISTATAAVAGGPASAAGLAVGEPLSVAVSAVAGGPTSAIGATVGNETSCSIVAIAGGPTSAAVGASGEPISATASAVAGGPTSAAVGLVGVPISAVVSAAAGGPTSAAEMTAGDVIGCAIAAVAGGPSGLANVTVGQPIATIVSVVAGGPTSAAGISIGEPIVAAIAAIAGGPSSGAVWATGTVSSAVAATAGGPTSAAIVAIWVGERPFPHSILVDDGIFADIEIINEAQMKPIYIGGMVNRRIVVRDRDGVLFTPDQLRVSFRWPDRSEESVTLGGAAPNDSWLRSVSIGVFRFSCPAKAQAGNGSLLVSLTHLVSGIEQTEEARQIVPIYALTNARQDVP